MDINSSFLSSVIIFTNHNKDTAGQQAHMPAIARKNFIRRRATDNHAGVAELSNTKDPGGRLIKFVARINF
jgi:hypothetical protein